jgi:hypothetical protein
MAHSAKKLLAAAESPSGRLVIIIGQVLQAMYQKAKEFYHAKYLSSMFLTMPAIVFMLVSVMFK